MSESVILRDFQFTRDFRKIRWGATFWYNILRAMCTGAILVTVMTLAGSYPSENGGPPPPVVMALCWPIGAFFGLMPFAWLMRGMAAVFPDGFGFFLLIPVVFLTAMGVSLGDPLVCILHKFIPKLVPIDDPPLFSTRFVYWVLDVPEISIAG